MKKFLLLLPFILFSVAASCQREPSFTVFKMFGDVEITIDVPPGFSPSKRNEIILYALPNGNSTAQTMGKKMEPGDDWHFDIQHIKAQTGFIREKLKDKNIVVVYLENDFKSWPLWKGKHPGYISDVQRMVDTLYHMFLTPQTSICLNGHSGGGRFVFSYLD